MAYSLDDLRADIEASYGNLDIDTPNGVVSLRTLLRLPDAKQKEVAKLFDRINERQENGTDALKDLESTTKDVRAVLDTVADDPAKLASLLDTFGEDRTVALMSLFQKWQSKTQAGEASA